MQQTHVQTFLGYGFSTKSQAGDHTIVQFNINVKQISTRKYRKNKNKTKRKPKITPPHTHTHRARKKGGEKTHIRAAHTPTHRSLLTSYIPATILGRFFILLRVSETQNMFSANP